MGFMLRVRLSAFFAGAAAASAAGFYLLYKDYQVAQESMSLQVKSLYETIDEKYTSLDRRIKAIEGPSKETETVISPDSVM